MLELLIQLPSEGSAAATTAAGRFNFVAAAYEWRQPAAADAAGVSGGHTASVKADLAASGVLGVDDADFDLFFEQLQPAVSKGEVDALMLLGGEALIDSGTEEFLQQFLLTDLAGLPEAINEVPEDQDEDIAESSTFSPVSFEPTASPTASSSLMPGSPTPSAASSSRSSYLRSSSGSVAGGRVDKKKEANREAAYRYRMKQRLGDSVLEQHRSELQSRADELAGGVGRAEEEIKFLMQMCRQIFSSRKQLLLANSGLLGSQLA